MPVDEKRKLSRRSALKGVVLLTGATLAAGMVASTRALAQQKVSKQAMKYQDKPNGDQKCSNCAQFEPPKGCKVVEGDVSPNGYCIAWTKKA